MKQKFYVLFLLFIITTFSFAQIANQPTDFIKCDENGDGFESFFLQDKNPEILLNQNPLDFVITFYLSALDAANGINNLLSENYQSGVSSQTIYVRLEAIASGNFDTTSFNLIISPPIQAPDSVFRVLCVESNNDLTALFDLTTLNDEILVNLDLNDTIISFYTSEFNAESNSNPITNPENYELNFSQNYYARTENSAGCFDVVQLIFSRSIAPIPNNPTPFEICSNNGIATFDLNSKIPEVINGLNLCIGCYQLTFHSTLSDAENGTNSLNPIYTNTTPFAETIYIRLMDEPGICYDITSLDLIINNGVIPDIGNVEVQEICATDLDSYDLTQFESIIGNGILDLTFTYFDDYVTMISNGSPLSEPENYDLSLDLEEIYVKATDNTSGCSDFIVVDFVYSFCLVSCESAINENYCYGNFDNRKFTYTSSNGLPLVVNFNSGSIHTSDDLIVKDSDGTVLYNGSGNFNANGNIYDLAGLNFQSSGNLISIEVRSNSNQSCESADGYEPWDFDVFCSESVGVININAFLDTNSNSILDAGETMFNQGYLEYEVNNDGAVNTINSSTGSFSIVSTNGTTRYDFNYFLYPEYENCFDLVTTSFSNISVNNGSAINLSFPVLIEQSCEDIAVFLVSQQSPRPGFSHLNYLVVENLGSNITSGTVEYTLDALLDINAISTSANYTTTLNANGFSVDFTDLSPGQYISITIDLDTPTSANIGDLVTNTAQYITAFNDIVPDNNISNSTDIVIASFDPNDKMESHGPSIVYDDFITTDEYLYYTIRFQNLGSAEAFFVQIDDVLDAQLDESTFQMLRSSHEYIVTRRTNSLNWFFNDINLPAEQNDSEGSNGFVYFKVKPKPSYAVGDIIQNSGSIIFDFNDPIETNVFETRFVEPLSVNSFKYKGFAMYPNPARTSVIINFNSVLHLDSEVTIYDAQGKQILKRIHSNTNSFQIDLSELQSGLYFVEMKYGNHRQIEKLVIEE